MALVRSGDPRARQVPGDGDLGADATLARWQLPSTGSRPYRLPIKASGTTITATLAVTLEGITAAGAGLVYEVITSTAAQALDGVTLTAAATVTGPAPASTGPVHVTGLGLSIWSRWDG